MLKKLILTIGLLGSLLQTEFIKNNNLDIIKL